MYENILVPTDGSRGAQKAVRHAIDIASKYGATVHALYVVDSSISGYPAEYSMERIIDYLEEGGEEAVEMIAEKAEKKGVEVVKEVSQGVPSKKILDYSDENDIDLVVMGSHGRTGIERLLLGSVTEKVVRKSNVPVMVVHIDDYELSVSDANVATEVATERMKEEGYEEVDIIDTYRGASTWVVVAETEDGKFNIHIDPQTSDSTIARIS